MMAKQTGSVRNLKMREAEELRGFQKAALDFSFLEHARDVNGIMNHHRQIHESIENEYSKTSDAPHHDIIVSGSQSLIYAYVQKHQFCSNSEYSFENCSFYITRARNQST